MRFLPLSLALPAVLCTVLLDGQEKAQSRPVNYDAESYLVQRVDSVDTMNADGTGIRERTMAVKVQSDAALRSFGVVSVGFASASERAEFTYVRVRRPDGAVAETPVADAQEQPAPVTRDAPFYSDLKEKQLPVKNLRVGDTLEWQFRVTRTKAEAPGEFWGQDVFFSDGVSLAETFELRYPASVAVTLWTNPKLNAKPVESTVDGQHIVRWTHNQLKPTTGPEAEAAKKLKEKTLLNADEEKDATEGSLPSFAWTTFKSWEAVGAWYRSLEGTRMAPDDAVKARVAELTAGKTTEQEKVQAVYAYVSANIRYIGVAFGIGRYQPHHADEVLDNQYGDCKDKHTLLAAMLTALGLHPDAVLIGEGVRFNPDVPSPMAFNHLITRVQVGGQPVWLDSTAEIAPYRMLSLANRDKQALVVPDAGAAKLERSPADPPFASFVEMKAVGALDKDGHSESKMEMTIRGDVELFLREFLHQVAPAQYEDFVKRFMSGLGYGGTVSHVEIGRPEVTANPLNFHFDYSRDKAGNWDQLQTLPQLLIVALPIVDEKAPPIQSIDLGWPRTEHSSSEMKLPEGWRAELPEAVHAKASFATYDITFRFEKGVLYADRKLVIVQEKIPAAEWKSYKTWQDKVSPGSEPYVQLVRHDASAAAPAIVWPSTSDADKAAARELIVQAYAALQERKVDAAKELFKQAEAHDEHVQGLWSGYASIQAVQSDFTDAIKNYQKELGFHPQEYPAYDALERVQVQRRQREDAKGTLHDWAAANPADPTPVSRLMALMLEDGEAAKAAAAGENALQQLPENKRSDETFLVQLGEAQVKAGTKDKGEATLLSILKTTQDPVYVQQASYQLMKAGLDLALIEGKERDALAGYTTETSTWTLDESPEPQKLKSSRILGIWSTLGQTYLAEGKLAQAEPYLQAAWLNLLAGSSRSNVQAAPVGKALGDLRMAQKNPTAALAAYESALSTTTGVTPVSREIADAILTATRAGGKHTPGKSSATAYTMRIVPLGPAAGLNGFAEYRLLLSSGGVDKAIPNSAKTLPGGTERLLKAKLPGYIPEDYTGKIVRIAALNCHSGVCELVFMPTT